MKDVLGKRPWFQHFARSYVRFKLSRNFADIRFHAGDCIRQELAKGPIILTSNHVAWWDPLLLVQLDTFLGSDGYCLMDKKSLAELPFFRWVGALPIDRTSPAKAYRDIERARAVLSGPGRILAMFPQGEQRPAHLPLSFKPGVAALAAHSGAPVIPLAIQYTYLESPRPVVHLAAGPALRFQSRHHARENFLSELEHHTAEALHRIDVHLIQGVDGFCSLLHKTPRAQNLERIPPGAKALRLISKGTTSS
jgi:1-acyl-sn-glycerol-3-phosphate acyltransferase